MPFESMNSHLLVEKAASAQKLTGQNTLSSSIPNRYRAYGLTIHSELLLPQLVSDKETNRADVTVRYGTVPRALARVTIAGVDWEISNEQLLLKIDGVATYWVNGPEEVWIERFPNANDDDVRLFLLGSTLGFLLHLRHILPLHASAICTDRGAVLFTGVSGSGKSTTLSAMVQRGYPMLADDVSGIVLDETGNPQVLSAFPASKLFADSVAKLDRSTEGLRKVKASLNKYLLPIDSFCAETIPLYAVYVLDNRQGTEFKLQPIERNIDKLSYFLFNTYRSLYVKAIGWEQKQFKLISRAIHHTKVIEVTRPDRGFLLDELVKRLEEDFNSNG